MFGKRGVSLLLLVHAGLIATVAQAIPVFSDTSEFVTFRTCIPGVTACDSTTQIIDSMIGGFPGALASSASLPFSPMFGSASGSATLSGVAGAPILRTIATSVSGARVNTNSLALQEYTYVGAAETTRTFGGTLTYSQTLVGGPYPPDAGGNGINALLEVFTLPGAFDAGDTAVSNFLALSAPSTQAGFISLGSAFFHDPDSNANGHADLGITVTLQPGESVFIWAFVQTPALNGSVVNANDTFVTQWDDSTNLVPAAVAVPEPATLALLGLGLAGLGFSRRKQ